VDKSFFPESFYLPFFLLTGFCASVFIFYLSSDFSLAILFAIYLLFFIASLITLYFLALVFHGVKSYFRSTSLANCSPDPIAHLRLRKRIKKPTLIDLCHGTPIAETVFVCGQYAAAKTVHTVHTINDRLKRAAKSSSSSRNQPNGS
jgi:hypothetical protein